MTHPRALATTSILALLASAPAAFADLTAEQVLADNIRQIQAYGMTVETVGQSRSGRTLTVESYKMTADVPEGTVNVTIGGASFIEQGDGTVRIEYPTEIPVDVTGTGPEGDFSLGMTISHVGLASVVTGSPERIRYDVAAADITVGDVRIDPPEDDIEIDLDFTVNMGATSGFIELGDGDVREYDADLKIGSMDMNMSASTVEQGEAGAFQLAMTAQDITTDYSGAFVPQDLTASFAELVQRGSRTTGSASYGPVSYTLSGLSPDGAFNANMAMDGGSIDFKMDEAGLDYTTSSNQMSLTVSADTIPFPQLSFSMGGTDGRFQMPLVPSEASQDFALRIGLRDLEVDDILWAIFDGAGQLPRDPATLIIDLTGKATLLEDIFDPEYAETASAPPGTLDGIDVKELRLNAVGAELTGDGAFTFDNNGPIPVPAGTANLMLRGGNGLLDTLVGMGLVPEEQAMGARMMLGLFARPGEGPDTLTSVIEMKPDGSIIANGQRIK